MATVETRPALELEKPLLVEVPANIGTVGFFLFKLFLVLSLVMRNPPPTPSSPRPLPV